VSRQIKRTQSFAELARSFTEAGKSNRVTIQVSRRQRFIPIPQFAIGQKAGVSPSIARDNATTIALMTSRSSAVAAFRRTTEPTNRLRLTLVVQTPISRLPHEEPAAMLNCPDLDPKIAGAGEKEST
jgi:hypothetical protein